MNADKLLEKLEKLIRGENIKINNEIYSFVEAEFSSPDYNPQFIFFKYLEPPKVCVPYSYIIECRKSEILFFKLTEGKPIKLKITSVEINQANIYCGNLS
ncbi:MAG: hypothetical protein WCW64_00705 [Phycisphaerae bacterium]|jgi:hypothetical protein